MQLEGRRLVLTNFAIKVLPVVVGAAVSKNQSRFCFEATKLSPVPASGSSIPASHSEGKSPFAPAVVEESDENSNYLRTNALRNDGKSPAQYQISFAAGKEFKSALEQMQQLAFCGDKRDLALENVFQLAMEFYISKHCPKERLRRREERKARKEMRLAGVTSEGKTTTLTLKTERLEEVINSELSSKSLKAAPREVPISSELSIFTTDEAKHREVTLHSRTQAALGSKTKQHSTISTTSRHIPLWLRDEVLKRDGYRCSYVSVHTGIKCDCPIDLEIDHIVPFARRGRNSLSILRVLCQAHNLVAAFEAFGDEFMEQKIGASRDCRDSQHAE